MGCFDYFTDKIKNRQRRRSAPVSTAPSPSPPASSLVGTSRSNDSGAGKQMSSKSSGSTSSYRSIPALYEERAHNLRVFELKELRNATNDFSRLLKIGEGGFGSVYKGLIKPPGGKGDSIPVAVKKLNQNGLQGHKQWLAEVQFLGIVEHPNLVKLIGYCSVDGERGIQRLLVYEFMPNRSLEDHLFNKAYPCLPWITRLQIALDAAEGLAYLHERLEIQVIYRDFKTSNVLLDDDFNPKLSDFGLAREGPSAGNTHVSTAVMGTYGYAAPEYVETGHLTSKSDVWSFGIVLFEILTGRRAMERNRPRNEQKLLDWLRQCRSFSMIVDPRLENQFSMKGTKEVTKLAYSCLSKNAKDRPKMSDIVESLKMAMQHKDLGGPEESLEEEFVTADPEIEKKADQANATESLRRRMLHLSKLSENANGNAMRKFLLMKAGTPA